MKEKITFMILALFCLLLLTQPIDATNSTTGLTVKTIDTKAQDLSNAVVMLTPLEGQTVTPTQTNPIMEQKNNLFTPFILPIHKDELVSFPNRDSIRHHVYSFSKAKVFELRLYGKDEEKKIVFDQKGEIALGCNIHDNMVAFIFVSEAPIFAKTDQKGIAVFKTLPPGKYSLSVWHADMKDKKSLDKGTITVSQSNQADLETVTLSVNKRKIRQRKPRNTGGRY